MLFQTCILHNHLTSRVLLFNYSVNFTSDYIKNALLVVAKESNRGFSTSLDLRRTCQSFLIYETKFGFGDPVN